MQALLAPSIWLNILIDLPRHILCVLRNESWLCQKSPVLIALVPTTKKLYIFFSDRTANRDLTRKDAIHRNSYSTRTGYAGNSTTQVVTFSVAKIQLESIKFIRSHCAYLTYTLGAYYMCVLYYVRWWFFDGITEKLRFFGFGCILIDLFTFCDGTIVIYLLT